jgi:hypothetical protein
MKNMEMIIICLLVGLIPLAIALTMLPGRRRKKFVKEHKAMSDQDFIRRIDPESEIITYILALRRSIAELCQIPHELIRPDDHPEVLASLCSDWDDLKIIFRLEELLGYEIGDCDLPQAMGWRIFCFRKSGPVSFSEWALSVGRYLRGRKLDMPNEKDAPDPKAVR